MCVLLAIALPLCAALQVPEMGSRRTPQLGQVASRAPVFDPLNLKHAEVPELPPASAMLGISTAAVAASLSLPEAAFAKGGEYGIFEGRIISLAHPTVMAICYAATAWAAFTGFQWRRLREIGNQITELKAEQAGPKKQLDALSEGQTNPSLTAQVAALQTQIDELTVTRKDLAGSNLRDKHYQVPLVKGARHSCDRTRLMTSFFLFRKRARLATRRACPWVHRLTPSTLPLHPASPRRSARSSWGLVRLSRSRARLTPSSERKSSSLAPTSMPAPASSSAGRSPPLSSHSCRRARTRHEAHTSRSTPSASFCSPGSCPLVGRSRRRSSNSPSFRERHDASRGPEAIHMTDAGTSGAFDAGICLELLLRVRSLACPHFRPLPASRSL